MKKVLALFLTFLMLLSLCACEIDDTADTLRSTSKPTTSTTPSRTEPSTPSHKDPTMPPAETPTAPADAPCNHSYKEATCTAPKTCTKCSATDGSPTDHKWTDATCSVPKTCETCGRTSGLTAGHTFSNGKCTSCGKSDPSYVTETMVWIPTKGGTKYHSRSNCSNMEDPEQVTQKEAETRGFTPCKRCH